MRQEDYHSIPEVAGLDVYLDYARHQAEYQSRSNADSEEMRDISIVEARSRLQEVEDLIRRTCRSQLTSFKEARTIEEQMQISLNDDLSQKSILLKLIVKRLEDRNLMVSSFPPRADSDPRMRA